METQAHSTFRPEFYCLECEEVHYLPTFPTEAAAIRFVNDRYDEILTTCTPDDDIDVVETIGGTK